MLPQENFLLFQPLSLAGQPFTRGRREGLVSCLYASCTCCSLECSPIRLLHIITNIMGLSQTHKLTNQVPDLLVQ